jgi:hypothetical protein
MKVSFPYSNAMCAAAAIIYSGYETVFFVVCSWTGGFTFFLFYLLVTYSLHSFDLLSKSYLLTKTRICVYMMINEKFFLLFLF